MIHLSNRPEAALVPATDAHARLRLWERAMSRANAAARLGQTLVALAGCHEALMVAVSLVESPPAGRACDAVAALVVSRHNLADLHAELGCVDLAAGERCRAHEELIALVTDGTCDAELQRAALRHLRETHAGLLLHIESQGPHPAITRALQRGCLVFSAGPATMH